jgi:hypothetical protein
MYLTDQLDGLRNLALEDYLKCSETPPYGEWAVLGMFPTIDRGLLDVLAVQQSEYMTS